MKKLILFLVVILSFGVVNAQNTLKISSNTLEMVQGSTSIWKVTGVSLVRKLNGNAYTIGGFGYSNDIYYANINFVSVNGGSAAAPVSYDSLYNTIISNVSAISSSGGSGGGVSSSVAVTNFPSTQVVSGTVSATVLNPYVVNASDSVKYRSSISVLNFPATQAISASSLPLPSGASTETTLASLNSKVTSVNTGDVVVSSSALPSGAATSALQTTGNTTLTTIATNTANHSVKLQDGAGTNITSTLLNSKQRLDVTLASAAAPNATSPTIGDLVGGTDGTLFQPLQMDASKNLKVAVQGTVPVSGTFWQATQPISGSVTATQTTAANLNATVVGTGTFAVQNTAAIPTGTNSIGRVVASAPTSTSGMITSATTAAGGTTFVTFASQACTQLYIANNTGTSVEFQLGGSGTTMPIFNGAYYLVTGITNASSVGIRRIDQATTQVTVQAHALTN
jgi:hypothetical protein